MCSSDLILQPALTYSLKRSRVSHQLRHNLQKSHGRSIFIPMKTLRRIIAAVTVGILAFRAVGSFLSWIEKQDDANTDAWIDEDEFEEA